MLNEQCLARLTIYSQFVQLLKVFKRILLILKKYKNIYGTYGIHPHETQKYKNIDSSFISKVKKKYKKIIGVGETGLDFFYNHSDKEVQKKSFIEHIKAASELNVPIIVHSRNAETDTYEILKSEEKNSNLKILMHCFTGSKDFAKKLLDINCYISVSGIITFKNSTELSETISSIPIENLLIEKKYFKKRLKIKYFNLVLKKLIIWSLLTLISKLDQFKKKKIQIVCRLLYWLYKVNRQYLTVKEIKPRYPKKIKTLSRL